MHLLSDAVGIDTRSSIENNYKEWHMGEIVRKEVCKCENCGNEAEMVVTCSLSDGEAENGALPSTDSEQQAASDKRVKGTATCTNCGNEADMWIDL